MGQAAAERPLAGLLAPTPGRLEAALRLTLICTASVAIAEAYQTPEVALTAYVAFFLVRPDRCTTLVLGLGLLVLASSVIGVLMLLANVLTGHPAMLLASIAGIAFGALFLTSSSRLKPVGAIVALVATYALSLLGRVPEGEIATRALLYAWLMVLIPVGVSTVVNLLLGPAPRRLAERALARRLATAARLMRDGDAETRAELDALRTEGTATIEGWLRMAALEHSSPARDLQALRRACDASTPLLRLVQVLDPLLFDTPERPDAATQRRQLADALDEMATILAQGGYPVQIELALQPQVGAAAAPLAALRELLAHFADADADADSAPPASEPSGGFFAADAFSNPDHLRFALKGSAAAMFCYGLYNVLDWPGIHTAFITCFIVALGSTAETVQKLLLRIAGCLLGAALGVAALLWVLPAVPGLGGLLVLLGGVTLVAAWIAVGSPRIAYLGFQLAFAFYLCVLQGTGPSYDLVVARDRVIGILIGNAVVYLVFTRLWPVSLSRRIDPALATLLRRLARIAAAPHTRAAAVQGGRADGERGAIAADLALLDYEPPSIRPDADWLQRRRHTLQCATALDLPLALPGDTAAAAPALDALAARLDASPDETGAPEARLPAPAGLPEALQRPLQALIDAVLAQRATSTSHAVH
jgi:multidrug resistance protein MdtO